MLFNYLGGLFIYDEQMFSVDIKTFVPQLEHVYRYSSFTNLIGTMQSHNNEGYTWNGKLVLLPIFLYLQQQFRSCN